MSAQRFRRAVDLFNQEQFFEAHEAWEEIWHEAKKNKSSDENFVKGLIQAAAAFHHLRKGNITGAVGLFKTSIPYLKVHEQNNFGIELDELLAGLEKTLDNLEANPKATNKEFPKIKFRN